MRRLSESIRCLAEYARNEPGRRNLTLALFSLLLACALLFMIQSLARRRNGPLRAPDAVPSQVMPAATSTKWWVRKEPSQTLTAIPNAPSSVSTVGVITTSKKCPAYAADFQPGTYGYISLYPPYENAIRSGAGKNYSSMGSIEVGGWVKILAFPVCADDGYVWLKVQSASSSGGWTAGGHANARWVLPCSDVNKKCTVKNEALTPTLTPKLASNNRSDDRCVSEKLAVGLDAQVSPDDLLILRVAPYDGSVLGHISPAAIITIVDGPECRGDAVWWKVASGSLSGWGVENPLKACPKEGECKPWEQD
jgi:hypothetical protein